MASTNGASSQIQTSNSEENLTDQRKRKRMQSNRESARRSRVKKQKQLEDLTAQISQISTENNEILKSVNVSTEKCAKVEAENSVLRAQMVELSRRLQSLNEILDYLNSTAAGAASSGGGCCVVAAEEFQHLGFGDGLLNVGNSWNLMGVNQQGIMASAEMFDYYY